MDIELNRFALAKTSRQFEGMTTKASPRGRKYIDRDGSEQTANRPLIRYAKCYANSGLMTMLFVRSFYEDQSEVERQMDALGVNLTSKQYQDLYAGKAEFEYLNNYLEEK